MGTGRWRIVGLDEQQAAGVAPDVHTSLIFIEATGGSVHALALAARRIRGQARASDSVLLLEGSCALLLPATPFSGAQAVASRLTQFLANVPCEIHVYHGTTALLVLQRLRASEAALVSHDGCAQLATPAFPLKTHQYQGEKKEAPIASLPYLAFLTHYPAPHLLHLFPYELACRYQCVPIGAARNMLTLGTCHWLNREVIAQLRAATRRGIFQVRCEVTMIDEILRYWQRLRAKEEGEGVDLAQYPRSGSSVTV